LNKNKNCWQKKYLMSQKIIRQKQALLLLPQVLMDHLVLIDLCLCHPLFPYNKAKPILKPQTPNVEAITTIIPKASPTNGNEIVSVTTPLWDKCEDETRTPKSGNFESFGTLETLELDCKGQNTSPWGVIYTIEKVLKCKCWKMASHEPFGHLQHKLWSKEGPRVKLAVWFPTTKSRELTPPWCVQVECNTQLESSWGELQVCFRPQPNRRSKLGVMSSQSPRSPNQDSFGTSPWESWDKKPFECRWCGQTQRIIYGGRWWLPPSSGRGESSESVLPVACPNTKSDSKWRAPKSRGETHGRVSQSQVAEVETWRHAPGFQL